MDIFQKVNDLGLPENSYVIVGGGVLVALGLLEWDYDIDICVAPSIFTGLQSNGWQQTKWSGKPVLKRDVYDVGIGFGQWSLQELQTDAMTLSNIPFMNINKLLQWKRQIGRPKDLQHIMLIEQYLQAHPPSKPIDLR